jgi:hypothetical protein
MRHLVGSVLVPVSIVLHGSMKKNWGVVQLVGHLTVNAHEAVLLPSARQRSFAHRSTNRLYS